MSQNEDCILSDGRKTSDLKVIDLKKELDKYGKRKTGTKNELIMRLNEALSASSKSVDINFKKRQVESDNLNSKRKVHLRKSNSGLDLDDSDDLKPDGSEMRQSVDTFDSGGPQDDSLNSVDDITQEDQIQINLSKDEEADMTLEEKQCNEAVVGEDERIVVCEEEAKEDMPEVRRCVVEAEGDEMLNMEMYEGDNVDLEVEERDEKKDMMEEGGIITVTVKVDDGMKKAEEEAGDDIEEAEEGEVVTVPISARLGKRKVAEGNEEDGQSPRKTKRRGLRETKGTGHIAEEPMRVQSPQRSKNIISDSLRLDNLVRPFTLSQLREILSLRGTVVDLWLNKIKSIAYVKYESESAAINARESLDGCKWPSINPKLLVADFTTTKEMEWMKEKGDCGVNPPSYLRQTEVAMPAWKSRDGKEEDGGVKADRRSDQRQEAKEGSKGHRHGGHHRAEEAGRSVDGGGAAGGHVAETGPKRGHRDTQKQRHRDGHRDGLKEASKKAKGREKSKEKNCPATKLLEDLFRKTCAQPCIYWLPAPRQERKEDPCGLKKAGGGGSSDMIVLGYAGRC